MENYVQDGKVLTVTAPYALTSGHGCLVGRLFGAAINDALISTEAQIQTEGVVALAKDSSTFAQGDPVYWDDSAHVATSTSSGTLIGSATAAAATGVATVNVKLNWSNGAGVVGVTASAAELNALAGTGLSAAELGVLNGITNGAGTASKAVVLDANKTFRLGGFNTGAALTLAVPFTTDLEFYTDGQLDIFSVFGGSGADLGVGYSAKCGRFRHVVNGITCNHETYGLVGQMVAKNVTFGHLHSGLMGTFEVNTAATVSIGDALGCAAVIGRVGGATITVGATGVLAGVLAAQLASVVSITSGGVHAAFACRKVGAGITWAEALHIEDALVAIRFKAASDTYAHGIKVVAAAPSGNTSHAIAVKIGTTDGFIPVYAAETF